MIAFVNDLGEAFVVGNGARGALNRVTEYSYAPVRVEFRSGKTPRFTKVAVGTSHTMLLTEHAEVVTFGSNSDGQMGRLVRQAQEDVEMAKLYNRKNIDFATRPAIVREGLRDKAVVQIACAPNSCFAVTEDGELYAWGSAADGILGLTASDAGSVAPTSSVDRPQLVEALLGRRVVQVAAGARHIVILDSRGQVYTCGFGGYFRLGLKDARDRPVPTHVASLEHIRIVRVAAGHEHTMAMSEEGAVFWWGRYGLRTAGQQTPDCVNGLDTDIEQLAGGRGVSYARTASGKVFVWGQPNVKEMLGMDVAGRDLNPPQVLTDFNSHKVTHVAACDSQVVVVVDAKTSTSEVCSACGETGNLMLCDTCPLSFHPHCLAEPCDKSDIPEVCLAGRKEGMKEGMKEGK